MKNSKKQWFRVIFEISRYRFLDLGHTKVGHIIQSFSVNIDFQWNSSIPGQSSWSVGRFSVAPNGLEYLGLGEFARWKSRQFWKKNGGNSKSFHYIIFEFFDFFGEIQAYQDKRSWSVGPNGLEYLGWWVNRDFWDFEIYRFLDLGYTKVGHII